MSILTGTAAAVRARSAGVCEPSWRQEMRTAIRDPAELCQALGLAPPTAAAVKAAGDFTVFVPQAYLRRIAPGDPRDPLLLQVLPAAAEREERPGFVADPVGDAPAQFAPGALQKYQGRALLIVTGVCAVHCRYCFRRHYPYDSAPRGDLAWTPALEAIAADPTIEEVILSGGDPLTLADGPLTRLSRRIAEFPQVTRLRIHTRLPIMIPSRVSEELIQWLTASRLTPIVVIHANHARELDDQVAAALDRLRTAGVLLLNQAVLLRGVNDSIDAQAELSRRLLECGATPYYLHQLDRAAGAAHFEVDVQVGRALIDALRQQVPGYMVPRYVREIAGAKFKTPL